MNWAEAYTQTNSMPGIVVGLWQDGKEVAFAQSTSPAVQAAGGIAYERDSLFRIFSMTKPITGACVLVACEKGLLNIDDTVKKFLPKFGSIPVVSADGGREAQKVDMTIRHLLTNTSGLSYGLFGTGPADKYIQAAVGKDALLAMYNDGSVNLQEMMEAITSEGCCLAFQPGTRFLYSLSCDVLGRILEIVHGTSLDLVFQEVIFGPLGMKNTSFYISDADHDKKLVDVYDVHPNGGFDITKSTNSVRDSRKSSARDTQRLLLSGGGGLVSTLDDYSKFAHALLNADPEGSAKVGCIPMLTAQAVKEMTTNQLPATLDGQPTDFERLNFNPGMFTETGGQGMGYGYAVSVLQDPMTAKGGGLSSVGEFGWGGVASTWFYVDPEQKAVCVFMSQLIPSSKLPVRTQLRWLTHKILKQRRESETAAIAATAAATFGGFGGFGRPLASASGGFSFGGGISVPAATGFSFGSTSPVPSATATATGGFGFGALQDALPPVVATPGRPVPSAAQLYKHLRLDDQDLDEVEEEVENARKAWAEVSQDPTARTQTSQIPKLFVAIKYFNHSEDDRSSLGAIPTWDELGFIEWHLKFLFADDEGDDDPDYQSENEEEELDKSGSDTLKDSGVAVASWDSVSWAQKPVETAIDGISWKCDACKSVTAEHIHICSGCGGKR